LAEIHESGDLPGQLGTAFRGKARAVFMFITGLTCEKPGSIAEEAGFFIYLLLPKHVFSICPFWLNGFFFKIIRLPEGI